jgi:hypothetical protein
MPTQSRAVEVKLDEATVLADLYSISYDLGLATHLAKAARKAATDGQDSIVVEGLVTASLIRYFRCFATNVRLGLVRSDLVGLSDQLLKQHDYFKDLRDKFVAHSVNPFEENWVTATASVRDGIPQPITSLAHGSHRWVLSVGEARRLSALTKQVRYIVDAKIRAEEERLLSVIQALPPDVVHGSDLRAPARFSLEDVGRTRRQTRALTSRSTRTRAKPARAG